MREDYPGQKLCIFISKNDKYEGIVLWELLLEIAFNSRLSGGTVSMGDKGFFGAQDESTDVKALRSSEDLPVLLEFQGRTNRIERYIERVQPMIKQGLLTRADVLITRFSSPDEEIADSPAPENENQSQIFNSEEQSKTEAVDLGQDQTVEDEEPLAEEPHKEFPSFDEEHEYSTDNDGDDLKPAPEISNPDQEDSQEEDIETPPTQVEEETFTEEPASEGESEIPEFQSLDDNDVSEEAVEETPEVEEDYYTPETDEEDIPIFQLTDHSEIPDEDSGADTFEVEDTSESTPETPPADEVGSEQSDENFDKLFDESNKEFDSSFEDMLKQAGGAGGADKNTETDAESVEEPPLKEEPQDLPEDAAAENGGDDQMKHDTNHTEEDVKSYFASLFKK